jgi:hypothetical protein
MKNVHVPNRSIPVLCATATALILLIAWPGAETHTSAQPTARGTSRRTPSNLWVDPARGKDSNPGTEDRPVATLSAALRRLPDPLDTSVTIELAAGAYTSTGGGEMAPTRLELMRRMTPGVAVRLIGVPGPNGALPQLAWEGDTALIDVREGDWWLENVQIGTFTTKQRRGLQATGTGHMTLKNVTFRTRSLSDAAIYAADGGRVTLRGAIRINEHLHDKADDESFAGIIATNHGLVRFAEREGASLDIGNGSLSSSYYGCIRLGCETARITNWSEHSNCLAINNGGRIDLHNTATTLCAKNERNTPIGLEHDGHILAEGALITITGANKMAIALQKASTFTCNDIDLAGQFDLAMYASSGSMFVGRFLSDVGPLHATTSASINIEKLGGRLTGPTTATHGGQITLPDRNIFSGQE